MAMDNFYTKYGPTIFTKKYSNHFLENDGVVAFGWRLFIFWILGMVHLWPVLWGSAPLPRPGIVTGLALMGASGGPIPNFEPPPFLFFLLL